MADQATVPTRRRPVSGDVIGTALLAVVGVVSLVAGLGYGFARPGGVVGPGFLPVTVGAFLLLAALAEIARLYLEPPAEGTGILGQAASVEQQAKASTGQAQEPELDTFGRDEKQRSRAIYQVFGLMLVALLLVPYAGLLLSLTAFVLAILLWVERRPLLVSLAATGGILLTAYLVFVVFLAVPVPQGTLGLL